MSELKFHEDDYCQIELLPTSARDFCVSEVQAIAKFSDQHKAPGGLGWTDMYMRKENPVSFSSLRVPLSEFERLVAPVLPKAEKVLTGYGDFAEPCKRTIGFGSEELSVFADFDLSEVVQHVWLTLDVTNESQAQQASNLFRALSQQFQLIMVDWGWGVVLDLNDTDDLNSYLRRRSETFAKVLSESHQSPWWKFWQR